METSWIKKLEKIRKLKVKEEKHQHRCTKQNKKPCLRFSRCREKDGKASEWNTKPCISICSGEFLRKEEAWTGPELPKVKEDLTFCLDINGTALTPRGLNVAESEGVEGNAEYKGECPVLRGLSTVQRCRLPRWCAIPGPSATILCYCYPSRSVMSVSRRNFWNSRVERESKSSTMICHIAALGTSVGKLLFCAPLWWLFVAE